MKPYMNTYCLKCDLNTTILFSPRYCLPWFPVNVFLIHAYSQTLFIRIANHFKRPKRKLVITSTATNSNVNVLNNVDIFQIRISKFSNFFKSFKKGKRFKKSKSLRLIHNSQKHDQLNFCPNHRNFSFTYFQVNNGCSSNSTD